jgi:hypothetical protein
MTKYLVLYPDWMAVESAAAALFKLYSENDVTTFGCSKLIIEKG